MGNWSNLWNDLLRIVSKLSLASIYNLSSKEHKKAIRYHAFCRKKFIMLYHELALRKQETQKQQDVLLLFLFEKVYQRLRTVWPWKFKMLPYSIFVLCFSLKIISMVLGTNILICGWIPCISINTIKNSNKFLGKWF